MGSSKNAKCVHILSNFSVKILLTTFQSVIFDFFINKTAKILIMQIVWISLAVLRSVGIMCRKSCEAD